MARAWTADRTRGEAVPGAGETRPDVARAWTADRTRAWTAGARPERGSGRGCAVPVAAAIIDA